MCLHDANIKPGDCPKCTHYAVMYDAAYEQGVVDCKAGVSYVTGNPYPYNGDKWRAWRTGYWVGYCEANPRPASQYLKHA